MIQTFARRLFQREERAFTASRFPSGAAPIAPAFRPPTTPGALPKPANFTFSPDRDLPLEQGIEAALPSRSSVQIRFWGAVLLVLLIAGSAIQMAGAGMLPTWLLLSVVTVAAALGGIAGWAHVMAHATGRLPGVIRTALLELPSRYEIMRKAKAEQGVRAPLWLSYAMAGVMANVVWPITTRILQDRMGMVGWLSLSPVKRVFSDSAEYASSVIRNEHTRYQHLQSVMTPVSVLEADAHVADARDAEPVEEIDPFAHEDDGYQSEGPEAPTLHIQADQATKTSVREAVAACIDDIEKVTATAARRLWWTMTTFAALAYATAVALLAAAWLLG